VVANSARHIERIAAKRYLFDARRPHSTEANVG